MTEAQKKALDKYPKGRNMKIKEDKYSMTIFDFDEGRAYLYDLDGKIQLSYEISLKRMRIHRMSKIMIFVYLIMFVAFVIITETTNIDLSSAALITVVLGIINLFVRSFSEI